MKKNKKIIKTFTIISTIILFSYITYHFYSTKNIDSKIYKGIEYASSYLRQSSMPSGKFIYRVNMNPHVKVKEKYNILRHSGAMYALGQLEEQFPNSKNREILKRSAEHLVNHFISSLKENPQLMVVWSSPLSTTKNNSNTPQEAKLGGTGLALIGLLYAEKFNPGLIPLNTLQSLGRFLLYMQKEDGSFYSKYYSDRGKNAQWTSLYYPGEAALGLLKLYQFDPNPQWLGSALLALNYLAQSRSTKKFQEVEADHWALLATHELLKIKRESIPKDLCQYDLLIDHSIKIIDKILHDQILNSEFTILNGGFDLDGKTTPTSTRLEGLLASLHFLPNQHSEIKKRIILSVEKGINFLMKIQIEKSPYKGAFPRAVALIENRENRENKKNIEDFNARSTEIRIDYVQHALSAFLQYIEFSH